MTRRIFVTRPVPDHIADSLRVRGVAVETYSGELPVPRTDLVRAVRTFDAVIVTISERVDADIISQAPADGPLRVLGTISTGTDHIDLGAAALRGLQVRRVPPAITAPATAELTLALMLVTARRLIEAWNDLRAGSWKSWMPYQWTGGLLAGRSLGVVGLGAIGGLVAGYGHALGMRVRFTARSPREDLPPWLEQVPFDTLLAASDVLSVHVPLTDETAGLIGERELGLLPPGALLINTSRGGVVDEDALLAALDGGRLAGAGIDVFRREPVDPCHPLVRHPRVVAFPHIGSATTSTRDDMMRSAVESGLRVLDGLSPADETVPPGFDQAVDRRPAR
ncbi:NAD(P)-dependent oxidoreductase [Nonomuraea cavernae]|uniref:NAD(P)-dependent oxidoreductase n=1 Tax=Nonomuraea cavernae TaxID=2045107 RepID=UPI00340587C9